jgi:hypothetical protein
MSKPIRPRQALSSWKKTTIGQSSVNLATLHSASDLKARIHLAFMAGFDAGAKAEHKKALRTKTVAKNSKG